MTQLDLPRTDSEKELRRALFRCVNTEISGLLAYGPAREATIQALDRLLAHVR